MYKPLTTLFDLCSTRIPEYDMGNTFDIGDFILIRTAQEPRWTPFQLQAKQWWTDQLRPSLHATGTARPEKHQRTAYGSKQYRLQQHKEMKNKSMLEILHE